MVSSSTCVCHCAANHLAGEQWNQWDWPASSIPPIPACKYEIFMVELPTVIKAGLTTIWAARGGGLKRQLIHKLYNVTLLARGFSALRNAKEGTMLLIAFISTPLSLFHLSFFIFLFASISQPEKTLTYRLRKSSLHSVYSNQCN